MSGSPFGKLLLRDEYSGDQAEPDSSTRDEPRAQPTHSEDGVDLTLIRWTLSLTPAERLDVLQQHLRSVLRLRGEGNDL
ncbi:MAG: hypothetical protein LAO07_06440 [Acidobacteriia bacterium]|nr:hypothetical protein [Terriglobia bacterium]